MVHGKTMQGRLGGICCAAMTVNASVVSAGLPLVATHMRSREKLLVFCIEKILSFLNVESIVVPGFQQLKRQSPYGWVQKTRM
ncbi:hypothetical protein ISN44_As09g021030 [Arabidopsis suecica]|nr:hypothetical protein ISN44_As09g021030 [Arabidopsis suecica]KAG7573856.1 hypothetical protein ISN44_As09g021030 [Arabidopsis suecica]